MADESFGTGNIFRDLGFDDWEELTEKADLLIGIAARAADLGMTIGDLADEVGLTVHALTDGDADDISVERLREIAEAVDTMAVTSGRKP